MFELFITKVVKYLWFALHELINQYKKIFTRASILGCAWIICKYEFYLFLNDSRLNICFVTIQQIMSSIYFVVSLKGTLRSSGFSNLLTLNIIFPSPIRTLGMVFIHKRSFIYLLKISLKNMWKPKTFLIYWR